MREHGLVRSAADLGLHGHACWTYDDDTELTRGAADFLADGVRLGQRLVYIASGTVQELRGDIAAMLRANPRVGEGLVEVLALEATFAVGSRADPGAMLAAYATATEQALADGFTGLRVVTDVTALVDGAGDDAAHMRWESAADRYMATKPLAALCCYDRRVLPAQVLSDVCAMHPVVHAPAGTAPFRLYAEAGVTMLDGEVDYYSADCLRRALGSIAGDGGVLDLSEVGFIDHHGVIALADSALDVRGIPQSMRRTCDLLGLPI